MKVRLALLAVPCIAVASFSSAPAHAQQPAPSSAPTPAPVAAGATDARALAEMLFFMARGMMEAGRYQEACSKLAESYRLDAAAGTLLNLAVCNEKIGKTASAWGEFRDAVAEARRMNRPDREKLASEHVAALEPELTFLAISVPPVVRTIRGLEISRNGVPLQSAAWDTDLPVDPGEVEVVERAPGYKPKTLHVTVTNKQHASFVAVPLEIAPIERPPAAFWTGKRTAGAVIAVAGVGAVVVGALFGAQALNDKKSSDANCPTFFGELRCTPAGVDDMNKANTAAWISNVALGAGAVGVGLGAFFFFTGGAREQPAATTIGAAKVPGWSWGLTGGPRDAMGTLSRSF